MGIANIARERRESQVSNSRQLDLIGTETKLPRRFASNVQVNFEIVVADVADFGTRWPFFATEVGRAAANFVGLAVLAVVVLINGNGQRSALVSKNGQQGIPRTSSKTNSQKSFRHQPSP